MLSFTQYIIIINMLSYIAHVAGEDVFHHLTGDARVIETAL